MKQSNNLYQQNNKQVSEMEKVKTVITNNFNRQRKRMREEFDKTNLSKVYLMAFSNYFTFCEKDILKELTEMENNDEKINRK